MRVIYREISHARYLYIKRNVEKVWGARYTLGARYLSKNTVYCDARSAKYQNSHTRSVPISKLPLYMGIRILTLKKKKKKGLATRKRHST